MRYLIFCVALITSLSALAQDGSITAKVVDDSNEAVIGAVYSLSTSDASNIKQGVTGIDGIVSITELPAQTYSLVVSFTGLQETETTVVLNADNMTADLGSITLVRDENVIDEVVVETQGLQVRNEVDRKIYDISQLESVKGGDLTDVLDNIPSVEVDQVNNSVSLRGDENVRITIDNRPTKIPLEALLRQLQADRIKEIEVITNPSSKYDATGVSGIINIVTQGEKLSGINGSLSSNYNSNNKVAGNGFINYKTAKWNLSASLGNYGWAGDYNGLNYRETTFGTSNLITNNSSLGDYDGGGLFSNFGIDHYIDSVNTLFMSFGYNRGGFDSNNSNTFLIADGNGNTDNQSSQSSIADNRWPSVRTNLSYQRDFSKNRNHNMLIDYAYGRNTGGQSLGFTNENSISNGLPSNTIIREEQDVDRLGNNHVIRLDFTNPYNKNSEIELGAKASFNMNDNDTFASRFDDLAQSFIPVDEKNNQYVFNQNVTAGYATIKKKYGKWGVKTGLRAEHTNQTSELTTSLIENNEQNYLSLFPSAYLSHEFTDTEQMVLSYARRISRPDSRQLNPFTTTPDSTSIWSGNPNLRPEFADVLELSHSKNWKTVTLSSAVYYRMVNDIIRRTTEVDGDNISRTTSTNYSTSNTKGAEVNASISPANWVRINVGGNYNIIQIDDSDIGNELKNPTSNQLSTNFRTSFTLPAKFSLQIDGRQKGPFETPQGSQANTFRLNAGASKKLFEDKGRLGINMRNILNDSKFESESFGENFYNLSSNQYRGRVFSVRFSYNFGKFQRTKRKAVRQEEKDRGSGGDIEQGSGQN